MLPSAGDGSLAELSYRQAFQAMQRLDAMENLTSLPEVLYPEVQYPEEVEGTALQLSNLSRASQLETEALEQAMVNEFHKIKQLMLAFEQKLSQLDLRTQDIMTHIQQSTKGKSTEPRELKKVMESIEKVSARMDERIQGKIEEHWQMNAGAMKEQIQPLKSVVEDHTSSLAKLERLVIADTDMRKPGQEREDARDHQSSADREPEPEIYGHLHEVDCSRKSHLHMASTVHFSDAPKEYKLSPSVWDATLLTWSKAMDAPVSIIMTLMFVANTIFLSCLSGTILQNFTEPEYDARAIEQLHLFREVAGHQIDYLDPITHASLASRICARDLSLALATDQLQRVTTLDNYLGDLDEEFSLLTMLVRGPFMCLMALAVWFLTLVQEVDHSWSFAWGFLMVPRARHTSITMSNVDGKMTIETIFWGRFVFVILTTLLRFALVAYLGYAGARYMINTTSLQELLLNCVALEIVLQIDEMLFAALSPGLVKGVLESLQPLPLKELPHVWHIDVKDVSLIILFFAWLLIFSFRYLTPNVQTLREAQTALCGGELDFVYLKDELGFVVYAPSDPLPSDSEYDSGAPVSYARRAVRRIVAGDLPSHGPDSDHLAFGARGLRQAIEFTQRLKATDSGWLVSIEADAFKGAHDMENYVEGGALDGSGRRRRRYPSILYFLRDALHDSTIQSCADVEVHCSDYHIAQTCKGQECRLALFSQKLRIARAFCPQTCGCLSPASGTIWSNFPARGCSSTSQSSLQYQMELKQLNPNCSDLEHPYLSFPDFRVEAAGKPIGTCANYTNFRTPLVDMCQLTSFSSLCPQTCECTTMIIPHLGCPSSCIGAHQIAALDHRQARER